MAILRDDGKTDDVPRFAVSQNRRTAHKVPPGFGHKTNCGRRVHSSWTEAENSPTVAALVKEHEPEGFCSQCFPANADALENLQPHEVSDEELAVSHEAAVPTLLWASRRPVVHVGRYHGGNAASDACQHVHNSTRAKPISRSRAFAVSDDRVGFVLPLCSQCGGRAADVEGVTVRETPDGPVAVLDTAKYDFYDPHGKENNRK